MPVALTGISQICTPTTGECGGEKKGGSRTTEARRPADKTGVEHPIWTFVRGDERLEISRTDVDDGVMMILTGDGAPRSYFFREGLRLEIFQRDMETLLLKTGWTFANYSPEKRRGRDRRGWPRLANDRRRWWTDGANDPDAKTAKAEPMAEPRREVAPSRPAADDASRPTGTRSK